MVASPLANPKTTKEILEQNGLFAKHSLGQNFLISDATIQHILKFAELRPHDCALEIGPGIGTLTLALLPQVKKLIAIEKDTSLFPVLQKDVEKFARADSHKLEILNQDALSVNFPELSKAQKDAGTLLSKFVSNLPYQIAATVVLEVFQKIDTLQSATVMVQREVAGRMQAKPGSKIYGAYTVKLSLWATVKDSFGVSRNNFMPAPHVDSAVVKIEAGPSYSAAQKLSSKERLAVGKFVDDAFSQRRKKMINSLISKGYEKQKLIKCMQGLGISENIRAEALSTDEFVVLWENAKRFLDPKS